jgi:hypothetical protein
MVLQYLSDYRFFRIFVRIFGKDRLSFFPNIRPIIQILPIIGITNIRFLPMIQNLIFFKKPYRFYRLNEYSGNDRIFGFYLLFKILFFSKYRVRNSKCQYLVGNELL